MLKEFEIQKRHLKQAGCNNVEINRHGWSFTKNRERHNLIRVQEGWKLGDKTFPFFLQVIDYIKEDLK